MTPRVDSWEASAVADRLAAQWLHGDALRGAGAGAGRSRSYSWPFSAPVLLGRLLHITAELCADLLRA